MSVPLTYGRGSRVSLENRLISGHVAAHVEASTSYTSSTALADLVSPVFSIRRLDFHDLDPARGALRGELTLHFDSDLPAVEIVEARQVVSLTGSNSTVTVTADATTLTLRIPGEERT